MARTRLRAYLDEVIGDADLHARINQVVDDPSAPAPDPAARTSAAPAPTPTAASSTLSPAAPAAPVAPVSNGIPSSPSPPPAVPPVPSFAPTVAAALAPSTNGADAPRLALRDTEAGDALRVARRRRRSASLLPPLPSPADLAEDAPGRVEIITISPPPDVTPSALDRSPATTPLPMERPLIATPTAPEQPPAAAALAAWLPVAALGVALLVIFIVGMVVTH